MFAKKCLQIGFALIFSFSVVVAASAAPELNSSALEKVIEGAKQEGTVTVNLSPEYDMDSMVRLEKEIQQRFGVALKINYIPAGRMAKAMATAMMEYKMGAAPSYDLEYYSSSNYMTGLQAGIWEEVDWKQLMTKDTPPESLLPAPFNAPVHTTTAMILMYNPEKVSDDEVPKSLSELADPKWKGKIGVFNYTSKWSKWWLQLGKDKGKAAIEAMLKNGAFQGRFGDLSNHYFVGEIWMAVTQSNFMVLAQSKGVPAKWVALREWVECTEGVVGVRKKAKHPNAAKLIAVYLASPAGATFTLETAKYGNIFVPGNLDYDIVTAAKKQQIPVVFASREPKFVEFVASNDYKKWQKEVKLTFETFGLSKVKKKK